jgi:hypothetical protein
MGQVGSVVVPEFDYQNVSLDITVQGLNSEPVHIPETDKWICPAPRASGLYQKRQCGVPSSYEERQ